MNTSLENIFRQEAGNTGSIHLHYCPEHEYWVAYGQSAVNLARLVPELAAGLTEEVFPDYEVRLSRLTVSHEQAERYALSHYCILLGDDYVKLQYLTDYHY